MSLAARMLPGGDVSPADSSAVLTSARAYANSLASALTVDATKVLTLVAGQDDESTAPYSVTPNHGTAAADLVNFKVGDRGWKFTATSTSNSQLIYDFGSTPLVAPGTITAICAWVWVADASAGHTTSLGVDVYADAAKTFGTRWTRTTAAEGLTVVNGWNLVRFPAVRSTQLAGSWGNVYKVVVSGATVPTNGDTWTVGAVWLECRPKGSLLIVNDGPYSDFVAYGYPSLLSRGLPCTLAIDPPYLGQSTGSPAKQRASQTQVDSVLADGVSSGSIHLATNGGDTNTMTAAQLRADVASGIKYCEQHGYTGGMWRAAWLGNLAPQAATVAPPLLLGCATYNTQSGSDIWPPVNRYNIVRWAFDSTRTNANLDTQMTALRDNHGLLVLYVHQVKATGVGIDDSFDTTQAQWQYLMGWIDTGVAAGWLEGVTFEQLYTRSGGRILPGVHGGRLAQYVDETGSIVTKVLA